jgi:hypothetical protein
MLDDRTGRRGIVSFSKAVGEAQALAVGEDVVPRVKARDTKRMVFMHRAVR